MRPDGNGKGDKPRPKSVPLEQFDSNWDSIFKKKDKRDADEYMCPNCLTPWKCNGPHTEKDKDESSTGHRDEQQSQQDMAGGN